MAGGEGVGGGERGEIAERLGPGAGGSAGADEGLDLGGQGTGLGDAAAGERDGEERGRRLGKSAAGAGEADFGDACVGRRRAGLEPELHGAKVATGRILAAGDAVGGRQGAAVARAAAVVVDDGLKKFGGGVRHASGSF